MTQCNLDIPRLRVWSPSYAALDCKIMPARLRWTSRSYAVAAHAVSVYYPFALTELVDYVEGEDLEGTGDILLAFRDEDGCKVTLRVNRAALEQLTKRLKSAPDRA